MALPAGGAILCWLLVMTLWLPLLNFARSYEPLVLKVRDMVGTPECVQYHGLTRAQGAAFEFHGKFNLRSSSIDANHANSQSKQCDWLIVDTQALGTLKQDVDMRTWQYQATVRRPSDNNEDIVLYKRIAANVAKP